MAKRGPKRRNLPFAEAREVARQEGIGSVRQYMQWHDLNKPAGLPRRPDRAYKAEFISWNDFLGNDTPFPCVRKTYRPFKEAKAFAQSLQLETKRKWLEFADTDKFPHDIPRRPDLYYRDKHEWVSWPNFLGVNLHDKTQTLIEADLIFFIIQNPKAARDYYRCGVTAGGISSIQDFIKKINGRVIIAFHVPESFNYENFLAGLGIEEHYEYRGYYHIQNLNQVVSKLSFEFTRVSSSSVQNKQYIPQ